MRRGSRALVMVAGAVIVTTPTPYEGASASCAGPTIDIGGQRLPAVASGQAVTVTGSYFVDGCNDTHTIASGGCTSHDQQREPVRALQDVTLSIRQHGHSWVLGTADANTTSRHLGDVRWAVTLPTALEPGRATLVTDRSGALRILVTP